MTLISKRWMEGYFGIVRMSRLSACPFIIARHRKPIQKRKEEILAYLETGGLAGTNTPFRVYLTCYRVGQAQHDRSFIHARIDETAASPCASAGTG